MLAGATDAGLESLFGVEPVAAPGVGVPMPPIDDELPPIDDEPPPIDDELVPMGAEDMVSGIGGVVAGVAVLAGVLGTVVVVSGFLPQAASANKAVSATMVTGVRRLSEIDVMNASLKGEG